MTTATQKTRASKPAGLRVPAGLSEQERGKYRQIPDSIDFVDHESFSSPSAEGRFFGESAQAVDVPDWRHFPEVLEDAASMRTKRGTLSAREEKHLFLRYNYARYRLSKLIDAQKRRLLLTRARQMILWHECVMAARSDIVRANMALVLAMARRTRIPNVEFTELISEGNMALLRSVEKFDVSRGFKLSTYACRAILKGFNRLATKTGRYRQHFPTEYDPDLEQDDPSEQRHQQQREDSVQTVREILSQNRAGLSLVEKTVVMERFAIGRGGKGRTLAEVGKMVGLTNERVRQIQNGALLKIRAVLEEDPFVA